MMTLLRYSIFVYVGFLATVNSQDQEECEIRSSLTLGEIKPQEFVTGGTEVYYTVDVSNVDQSLTITITPLGNGDPDLYVSFSSDTSICPNSRTSYDDVGRGYGEDSVTIEKSLLQGVDTVYVGVHGYARDSEFSILAVTDETVSLHAGTPQSGSNRGDIHRGETRYFQYDSGCDTTSGCSPPADVTVTVTPFEGSPELFISNSEAVAINHVDPDTYQWHSFMFSAGETIIIHSDETEWPANGIFHIAVYATSDTEFNIVATQSDDMITLVSGVPQREHIETGMVEYFLMNVTEAGCTLSISVTTISGDPDLYVSNIFERPNHLLYQNHTEPEIYRAIQWGSDHLTFDDTEAIPYYIGVHAYNNASFTITALVTDCQNNETGEIRSEVLHLVPGVGQSSHLPLREEQFYQVIVSPTDVSGVVVSVTADFGDPDVYVTIHDPSTDSIDDYPTRTEYTWGAYLFGQDVISISDSDENWCPFQSDEDNLNSCEILILVYAYTDTQYTITVTTRSGDESQPVVATELADGVPYSDYLDRQQYAFFIVTASDPMKSLTVTVTSLSGGDPDIYMSTTDQLPLDEDSGSPSPPSSEDGYHIWKATMVQDDSITVEYTNENFCTGPCSFAIAVYAYSNARFDIVAHFEGKVQLQDGVPQTGQVEKEAMIFYQITVPSNLESKLTITLTALNGFANIYINNQENILPDQSNTDTFIWSTLYWNSISQIEIEPTDENRCTPIGIQTTCSYTIGVWGVTQCDYRLIALTESGMTSLQSGIAQNAQVDTGEWAYFSVDIANSNQMVTLTVTPLSGDPDLFTSFTNDHPNSTEHDKYSRYYGEDSVSYSCEEVATHLEDGSHTTLFIGIEAYLNSSFSILAVITDCDENGEEGGPAADSVTQLIDGIPQSGTTEDSEQHYIMTYTNSTGMSSSQIDFRLTVRRGDPSIAVKLCSGFDDLENGLCTWPTEDDQDDDEHWSADSITRTVQIPDPKSGVYQVTVYSDGLAEYSITASTGIVVVALQNGVPLQGELDRHIWAYYSIAVNPYIEQRDLKITVTRFSGDPDLYVSSRSKPTLEDYEQHSVAWQSDAVTFPHAGLCSQSQAEDCTYYIGVYAYAACSYSITATFTDRQRLEAGVPMSAELTTNHETAFYQFFVTGDDETDISISITVESGNPNLYVSTATNEEEMWPQHDDPTTYYWSSTQYFTGEVVIISPDDAHYCHTLDIQESCAYHIAVYAQSASNYTITVSTSLDVVVLVSGTPVRMDLPQHEWKYFSFSVDDEGRDLSIAVTPFNGDPDLYVSTEHEHPGRDDSEHEWQSTHYGVDVVTIPQAAVATYYIGVYAYTETSYTMTAYAESSDRGDMCISLTEGGGQHGVLLQGLSSCYAYQVSQAGLGEIQFSVTREYGDPDLYVKRFDFGDEGATAPDPQDEASYDVRSISYGIDVLSIENPEIGKYLVTVHAASATAYTLTASSPISSVTLQEGIPFTEELTANEFEYFQFRVVNISRALTVTVTAFGGDPDLFMSTTEVHPNFTNADHSARSYREDSITIPPNELEAAGSDRWYIGVEAYTNCTFTILARSSEVVILQDGVPQDGQVVFEETNYYKIRIPSTSNQLTVTLSPLWGSVYVYVSDNHQDPIHDRPETYQWASVNSYQANSLNIASEDGSLCPGFELEQGQETVCEFTIGTFGIAVPNSTYSLVLATEGQPIPLQDGIPQHQTADQGAYVYFSFEIYSADSVVSIFVTPITGDPDLYVSTSNPNPDSSDYDWSGIQWHEDYISIEPGDEGFIVGKYYIAVYAYETTVFMITADTTSITDVSAFAPSMLLNGVPQGGLLDLGDSNCYLFHNGEISDIIISLVTRFGSVATYFSQFDDAAYQSGQEIEHCPSSDNNDGMIPEGSQTEVILNACSACSYVISVVGQEHSLFTITVETDMATVTLQSGVPFPGVVESEQYRYFKFTVDDTQTVLISCDSISGDPDIYVSRLPRPVRDPEDDRELCVSTQTTSNEEYESCIWYSIAFGSDLLELANLAPGEYFVGVYGYYQSQFSITISVQQITLVDGISSSFSLDGHAHQLYSLRVSTLVTGGGDIVFTAVGQVEMYITTDKRLIEQGFVRSLQGNVVINDTSLSSEANIWSTQRHGDSQQRGVVTISDHDPNRCTDCTYYVRAENTGNSNSAYSITASTGKVVQLSDGVLLIGSVQKTKIKYYQLTVSPQAKTLQIIATAFTGDVSIYVSDHTNTQPTAAESGFKSENTGTGAQVSILNPAADVYYVGVYGNKNSSYSIIASTRTIQLTPGTPQTITSTGEDYFWFKTPSNEESDITISIAPTNIHEEFYIVVYSRDPNNVDPDSVTNVEPAVNETGTVTYDFGAENPLIIGTGADIYCKGCHYYLGVYDKGGEKPSYVITVDTGDSVGILVFDRPVQATVERNDYKYYEMLMDDRPDNLYLTLETCAGNADMYMKNLGERPTKSRYTWGSALAEANDEITIKAAGSTDFVGSQFYIGVYGQTLSSFRLIATTVEPDAPELPEKHSLLLSNPQGLSHAVEIQFPVSLSDDVSYTVYYSKMNDTNVMYSVCGLELSSSSLPVDPADINNGVGKVLIKDLDDEFYEFNVVAESQKGAKSLYISDKIQVIKSSKGGNVELILGIVLPILVVAVLAVAYLAMKNRKLSQELEIEMHDVPKAAVIKAVRGPQGIGAKNPKKYSRLLVDDEDDDDVMDADDYSEPPI